MPRRTSELPKSGPNCLELLANCGPNCHPRIVRRMYWPPPTFSPANASENPGIAEIRPALPRFAGELRSEVPSTTCAECTENHHVFSGECLGEPRNCRNQARIAWDWWRIAVRSAIHELRRTYRHHHVFSGECLGEPPQCRNQTRIISNCWQTAVRLAIGHETDEGCTDLFVALTC